MPGWSSRAARSRCASTLTCSAQVRAGPGWQSISASTPSTTRSRSCSLLRTCRYSAAGTTPRRVARARMLSAPAPSVLMTVSASATTRSRVSPDGYFVQWFDPSASTQAWAPALDISEREDAYLVTVELPGVRAEDVEITFEDGLLTIQGERHTAGDPAAEKVHRAERRY